MSTAPVASCSLSNLNLALNEILEFSRKVQTYKSTSG